MPSTPTSRPFLVRSLAWFFVVVFWTLCAASAFWLASAWKPQHDPDKAFAAAKEGVALSALKGQAFTKDGVLVIHSDPGGKVIDRMVHHHLLQESVTPVAVLGICASACVSYVSLRNVCTAPRALWSIHPTQYPGTDWLHARSPRLHRWLHTRIANSAPKDRWEEAFPPALRAWMQSVITSMPYDAQATFPGSDLIANGWMAACPGTQDQRLYTPSERRKMSDPRVPSLPTMPRASPGYAQPVFTGAP